MPPINFAEATQCILRSTGMALCQEPQNVAKRFQFVRFVNVRQKASNVFVQRYTPGKKPSYFEGLMDISAACSPRFRRQLPISSTKAMYSLEGGTWRNALLIPPPTTQQDNSRKTSTCQTALGESRGGFEGQGNFQGDCSRQTPGCCSDNKSKMLNIKTGRGNMPAKNALQIFLASPNPPLSEAKAAAEGKYTSFVYCETELSRKSI